MSTPTLVFDKTGINPANRVPNIAKTITLGGPRIVILPHGSFYSDTVTVTLQSTGENLVKGDDWSVDRIDTELSTLVAKEVGISLWIKDPNFSGTILVTANMVGGSMGMPRLIYQELTEAINAASEGGILWERVNAPETFPPDKHGHPLKTLTELEILSNTLMDLKEAIRKSPTTGTSANELENKHRTLLKLISGISDDVNRLAAGGTGGADEGVINNLNDSLNALSSAFSDILIRQFNQEVEISELQDILTRLMTQLADQLEESSNSIDVTT